MAAAGSEGATLSILAKKRTSLALNRIHLAAKCSEFVMISVPFLAVTCTCPARRFVLRPARAADKMVGCVVVGWFLAQDRTFTACDNRVGDGEARRGSSQVAPERERSAKQAKEPRALSPRGATRPGKRQVPHEVAG
jgi:hypothetical protein